jgi:hypothetical protein
VTSTFVKQYGLERTGTNAARTLLETYVPGTTVLMHVLGDKHSPPVDLPEVLRFAEDTSDPALTLLVLASDLAPAETTRLHDSPRQRAYLEAIAPDVYEQVRSGCLRVVVSVREPCSWIEATLRWRSQIPAYRRAAPSRIAPLVAAMCDEYNDVNRAWSKLKAMHPSFAVVRHEELAGDLDALAARLVRELSLPDRPLEGARLPHTVGEADWDCDATPLSIELDSSRRHRDEQTSPLAPALVEMIAQRIDWQLASRWGYTPAV